MSSDHYATLGVSPSAESAAIRAAYRKLMRRYHPDTNPDPKAHKRAQAITAAYSVLRDRGKRARYDEERRDADIWRWVRAPVQSVRQPAARTTGIAASVLAALAVGAVLLLPLRQPPPDMPAQAPDLTSKAPDFSPPPSRPPRELAPESERLADISGSSGAAAVSTAPPPQLKVLPEPATPTAKSLGGETALPEQASARSREPKVVEARRASSPRGLAAKAFAEASPTPVASTTTPKPVTEASPASPPVDAARVASLQRISSGFYDQSLQNADTAKKQQLLNVRVRETYQRAACRSDSCVADSYLRQIRDVGAIMNDRAAPSK